MIPPDAVRVRIAAPRRAVATGRLVSAIFLAIPVYFLVTPGSNVDVLLTVLAFALVMYLIHPGSMWLSPADGVLANRRWGWYVFRYPLAGDPTVRLITMPAVLGERVGLRVRPEGARASGYVVLLVRTDDTATSLGAGDLHLLADMLDTHCPAAAPDAARHLRAQADHVAAGLPALDSPLVSVLDG